jgi:hypothetical protein
MESRNVDLVVIPVKGTKEAIIERPIQCNEKQIPLKLSLDLGNAPLKNGSVPVKIVK